MKAKNPFGTQQAAEAFCKENAIIYLGLFGSYARGEEKDNSDIDLLFNMDHTRRNFTLFDLVNLRDQLTHKFGRPVDLVSKLNKHVEPYVEKDLIPLYEER